jgi:hypothetical protein
MTQTQAIEALQLLKSIQVNTVLLLILIAVLGFIAASIHDKLRNKK